MTISAAIGTENNTGGNGQFSSLRRRSGNNNKNGVNMEVLESLDPRMRFRNSTDPIYVAYDYIDNQPISKLAASFVKDSFSGIINFVSKVVKN